MAYVYRHIRLDKNEPFYIGIGSDNNYTRANEKRKNRRNKIWNDIYSKTEIEIEILFSDISYKFACQKEMEFVSLYGRINTNTGILANLTDGGDTGVGRIVTLKEREYRSKLYSGINNPMYGKQISDKSKEQGRLKRLGLKPWNFGLIGVQKAHNAKLVLDLENGIFYESIKKAAESKNIKHSTLKSRLNGGLLNNTSFIFA
jgi:hypothetical protein